MADSKITALTALTAADPVNDMFPVVDVSDTSMAASGTTKRISVNNILGASGTATLASATITGAATVGTTLGVTGVSTFAAGTALLPALTTTGDVNTGIYYPAADTFAVTTGGTERYRVDSSGNVGVGVTPSAWSATFRSLDIGSGTLTSQASQQTIGLFANAFENGTNYTRKALGTAAGYSIYNGAHYWLNAVSGAAASTFSFGDAKMTLESSGNLLVGTVTNTNSSRVFARGTGGTTTLAIQSSTGDTANPGLLVGKFDNNSTTSQILVRFTINDNSAGSGQITSNGANAAAFGTFSDSRLKDNIVSLPSQLANILSLRPVEFDYKDGSGHQIGFVAQEMQEIYSDAVGEQNEFLTVTGWSKTEARLVSAIKELAAKVQALEAKLA